MYIYSRELKAGVPIESLEKLKILLCGAGNTGSHFTERAAKNFIKNLHILDFDPKGYEKHNFPHSSILLNPEEDEGKNKAETLAMRANQKLLHGGKYIGKTMDVRDLGPEFVKNYDFVLGFFDNTEARAHLYRISRQAGVPFIEVGIGNISGQLQAFDHSENAPCYGCSMQTDRMRNPCEYIYKNDLENNIAGATDILGAIMADLAMAFIMSSFNKENTLKWNTKYVFNLQNFTLETYTFVKKPNCILCGEPLDKNEPVEIDGSINSLSFNDLKDKIKQTLGDDFIILLPASFVEKEYCPVCGKEHSIMKPLYKVSMSEIICPECIDNPNHEYHKESITYSGADDFPDYLSKLKLIDLGFKYGEHISVLDNSSNIHKFNLKEDKATSNIFKEE